MLKANAEINVGIGEPLDEKKAQRAFAAFEKHIAPSLSLAFQQFGKHLDNHRKQLDQLSADLENLAANSH